MRQKQDNKRFLKKYKAYKLYGLFSIFGISIISLSLLCTLSTSTISPKNSNLVLDAQEKTTKSSVTPKPLNQVSDLKITSPTLETGAISTEEVTDKDGNYILTASGTSSGAKVVKLNFQMQYLYQWSYSDSSYSTRQIVADTDDLGYYYALLVSKDVSIAESNAQTSRTTSYTFTLTKPALVVQLYDTGSSFEQRNVYQLQLPNFSINDKTTISSHLAEGSERAPTTTTTNGNVSNNIWDDIYVQAPIGPEDKNEKLSFVRSQKSSDTTANLTSSSTDVYINDPTKSTIYKLLDKNSPTQNGSTNAASFSSKTLGNYYILKQLYLNNANNMVYIKDPMTNKKMILLFGGNTYQSLWFYDFVVTTNGRSSFNVEPLLYANYDFDPLNARQSSSNGNGSGPDQIIYGKVKKKFYYLPFMKNNKISNLAWYVGGAKTLEIKNKENGSSSSYVFLAMMQPNISDFNEGLYTTQSTVVRNSSTSLQSGTYGTPNQVSAFDWQNVGTNIQVPIASQTSTSNNVNLQTDNQNKYNNKKILIGSSSINGSYQILSPQGYGELGVDNPDKFWYPFSAIQSLTVFPVMSSSIASLVAVDPTNQNFSQKIYLSSFFTGSSDADRMYRFSLFNCVLRNKRFYKFDFDQSFINTNPRWTIDPVGPILTTNGNTGNLNLGSMILGPDKFSFSRAITNINPTPSESFNSLNDGWSNSISQKLIAFSPQIIENNNSAYDKIVAVILVRGYVYSFEYNLVSVPGINGVVPVSNFKNNNSISISTNSNKVNSFGNLLSLSYTNKKWLFSYQDTSGKHMFFSLTYDSNTNFWSFYQSDFLEVNNVKNQLLNKVISCANDCYFLISNNNNSQKVNFVTNSSNNSITDTSLNGGTILDNKSIWGTVSPISHESLVNSDLISKTPNQIISDYNLLNQLINYSGGWSVDSKTNLPTQQPLIINPRVENSEVVFDIALMYLNGIYYTSANFDPNLYPNVVQDLTLNTPTFRYGGFAPMEPWVLPVIISVSILLFLLIVSIGVGVPLSIRKDKKLVQKGFGSTNKKIDTLTSAVGNVYQKVITQTKNTKQPQMLKSSSNKPNTQNNKPFVGPSPKPVSPNKDKSTTFNPPKK